MGDRSGSREPKLSSLKKSKKNPGAPAGRTKRLQKSESSGPSISSPPPLPGPEPYFDCAMAILSRQFERDRDKVLQRSKSEGVCAIICWFSDIEKLEALLEACKTNSGLCYLLSGVHPDNIERTNKKSNEVWMAKVEEIARHPVCLGILSGLNLTREIGTHFAQESLLISACGVADKLLLPLVIHIAPDGSSLDKAIEILRTEGWTADSEQFIESQGRRRVILHDAITACGADKMKMKIAIDAGFYFVFSAAGLTDPDSALREKAMACVAAVPHSRILCGTDSPWRTPQNLPDPYLRTLRNEPCNMKSIIQVLAAASAPDMPIQEFEVMIRTNSITVYGLDSLTDLPAYTPSMTSNTHNTHTADKQHSHTHTHEHDNTHANTTSTADVEEHEEYEVEGIVLRKGKDKKKKHKILNKVLEEVDDEEDNDDTDEDTSATTTTTTNNNNIKKIQKEDIPNKNTNTNKDEEQHTNTKSENIITGSYFGCLRCRCRLFSEKDVVAHGLGVTKTVFKVGEEGLCTAAVFVPCIDNKELTSRTKLGIMSNTLECSECGCKLGKFSSGDATCPCGAIVHGPIARVIRSKVDFFDDTEDTATLLARSRIETEDALIDADHNNYDDDYDKHKKSKKKKKISRLDNRGNFSNFRNKSFVPNASRNTKKSDTMVSVALPGIDDSDEEEHEDDEDESSDDNNEQVEDNSNSNDNKEINEDNT
eukprot:gene5652-11402_t